MRVAVAVAMPLLVRVGVAIPATAGVCVFVGVPVGVEVRVAVGVSVSVPVGVPVGVGVAVAVDVRVLVAVGVPVAVWVAVLVPVAVGGDVAVSVAVGVSASGPVDVRVPAVVGARVSVSVGVAAMLVTGTCFGVAASTEVGDLIKIGLSSGPQPRIESISTSVNHSTGRPTTRAILAPPLARTTPLARRTYFHCSGFDYGAIPGAMATTVMMSPDMITAATTIIAFV